MSTNNEWETTDGRKHRHLSSREIMKREQQLDYHIADNAGTPHVSITDAESGDALFQSVFSVERCELAEQISKRFNSHEKLIEALQAAIKWMDFVSDKLGDADQLAANVKKYGAVKYLLQFGEGAGYRASEARAAPRIG